MAQYNTWSKIYTQPLRENQQKETTTQKRNKMGLDDGEKCRFQQNKAKTDKITLPSTLQRQQRKYCHHRRQQNRIKNSTMAETKQQ